MQCLKFLKNICFILITSLILQMVLLINANATEQKTRQPISSRYFEDRFEITISGLPTKYENITCSIEGTKVQIKNGKLIISGLAPNQVYNNVKIVFTDDIGRKYELELDNVITSTPTKHDNKFVYDVYKNGLGRDPEHDGFKYWYNKLSNHEVTAVSFIKEIITSDEFNTKYKESIDKIEALYKTILGRAPEEEGLMFWLSEFDSLIESMGYTSKEAILDLAERMMLGEEFIDIVNSAGFLYK